jgi:hypothetical protein
MAGKLETPNSHLRCDPRRLSPVLLMIVSNPQTLERVKRSIRPFPRTSRHQSVRSVFEAAHLPREQVAHLGPFGAPSGREAVTVMTKT